VAARATDSLGGRALLIAAKAAVAGAVFWIFRARHTLLGDGNVIVATLPSAEPFHPRAPLSAAIEWLLYGMLSGSHAAPHAIARDAVALGSVLAGVLFVPCALLIATNLANLRPPPAEPPTTRRAATWLLAAAILAQGYVQLFFGYVEHYTFLALALGVYLWLALRFLAGRSAFVAPACAAFVAVAFHLSAGIILPSLLFLAAIGIWDRARRRATLRDLAVAGVALAVLAVFLGRLGQGYGFIGAFLGIGREAVFGGMQNRLQYMFSMQHLRDFTQEQLLVGPLGLALFLPAVYFVVRAGWRRISRADGFWLFLGASFLGASWVAGDSNLGYARNWDLLAPGGVVFTVAGLALFLRELDERGPEKRGPEERGLAAALVAAVAMSLYHTVPWIAVNASEERGLARIKTLPLGGGREQMVAGNFYLRRGDLTTARYWLEQSFNAYDHNVSTCYLLGTVYSLQGETERALSVLEWGAELRPNDPDLRRRIVDTLTAAKRPADALPHVERLTGLPHATAADWARYGNVLATLGRRDEAAAAGEKALAMESTARRPQAADASLRLGELFAALGQHERALESYARATEAQPDSIAPRLARGRLLLQLGRRAEARDSFEVILQQHPRHRRRAEIDSLLRQTGMP
jgi:tetratricopeptide (TPR) repeat protein